MTEWDVEFRRSAREEDGARVVAAIEMGGGLFGICYLAYLRYPAIFVNVGAVDGLMVALCSLSIYSGWYLWQGSRLGYQLSLLTQSLQVVRFAGPAIAYQCFFGVSLMVGWFRPNLTDMNAQVFGFGSGMTFHVTLFGPDIPFGLGINVIALWALIYLRKLKRRASELVAAKAQYEALAAKQAGTTQPSSD
jgi:hypothetical protein